MNEKSEPKMPLGDKIAGALLIILLTYLVIAK